ncbi:MAG: 4Fe-4S dicluster domain-containing protein [Anaerolineales bacterium]|nr:MAG: 4Fe-4S dicluster domain-containing protein [Anaerolineales bacterium]
MDYSDHVAVSHLNTLAFNAGLCINCGMCMIVCPQGVFAVGKPVVKIVEPEACMECGACQMNCPVGALVVDSGVGCASAMISAALRGKSEVSCGGPEPGSCCG